MGRILSPPPDVLDYFGIGPLCPTCLHLSFFFFFLHEKNRIFVSRKHLSSSLPLASASAIYTSTRLSPLYSGDSPTVVRHDPPRLCHRVDRIKPKAKITCRSSIQNPDNCRIIAYRYKLCLSRVSYFNLFFFPLRSLYYNLQL